MAELKQVSSERNDGLGYPQIEKGVPLSTLHCKYPFSKMEIGDSFVSQHQKVRGVASHHGHKHNMKFTVSKTGNGFRVWRVA